MTTKQLKFTLRPAEQIEFTEKDIVFKLKSSNNKTIRIKIELSEYGKKG